MTRIAVLGAGGMAHVRTGALRAAGGVEIVGVAARRWESAERFAKEIGCPLATDRVEELTKARPEALLVEVPHAAQDDIVLWALERRLHVLIGGAPAGSVKTAKEIARRAAAGNLVVETGYEARYNDLWRAAREAITEGRIGRPVAVRSIALWAGDPATWYYDERASGGMPLVHMTYCFVNPVRWLLGNPVRVSAFANRLKETGPATVREETCVANMVLPGEVLYSATAGFVRPAHLPAWSVTVIGTEAALEIVPREDAERTLTVYGAGGAEVRKFGPHAKAFEDQAAAFVGAVRGDESARAALENPPEDAVWDVVVAEAIVASARSGETVEM